MSTPARGLSQAGCCVRAVDVGVMVDVSSGSSSCVFFFPSVVGRRREEVAGVAREGRGTMRWLELAVIDEKDA